MRVLRLIILLILLTGAITFAPANASSSEPPQLPTSIYGQIDILHLDGELTIEAWAGDQIIAQVPSRQVNGLLVYSLDIPADNPATLSTDGATENQAIKIHITGTTVEKSIVWHSGIAQRMDFSLPSKIYLPIIT